MEEERRITIPQLPGRKTISQKVNQDKKVEGYRADEGTT